MRISYLSITLLALCFFETYPILYTVTIIRTPKNKLIYLFGETHTYVNEQEIIDLLTPYFSKAEKSAKHEFHVLFENIFDPKLIKLFEGSLLSKLRGRLANLELTKTTLEGAEVYRLGGAWDDCFAWNEHTRQLFSDKENPTRKEIEELSGLSYEEVMRRYHRCIIQELTFQQIIDTFGQSKGIIDTLFGSLKDDAIKKAYQHFRTGRESKMKEALTHLNTFLTPQTKLFDFGAQAELEITDWVCGHQIGRILFDLHLLLKIFQAEAGEAEKIVAFTGSYHTRVMEHFFKANPQLGYKVLLTYNQFFCYPEGIYIDPVLENLKPRILDYLLVPSDLLEAKLAEDTKLNECLEEALDPKECCFLDVRMEEPIEERSIKSAEEPVKELAA